MRHRTFTLKGQNIVEPISNFVKKYYRDSDDVYVSEYTSGLLVTYEDYSFLNGERLMVCLRLDSTGHENGSIKIEVIAAAAYAAIYLEAKTGA